MHLYNRGEILVFAGKIAGSDTNSSSVQSLAINDGKWKNLPDMPQNTVNPEVCNVDGDIYVLKVYNNNLLHMNGDSKSWSVKAVLPTANCLGARMVNVKGRLYVAGGKEKILAWYTPSTNTWRIGAQTHLEHNAGTLLPYGGKSLYLLGGFYNQQIEQYDIEADSWSVCEYQMPKAFGRSHGLILDKHIVEIDVSASVNDKMQHLQND